MAKDKETANPKKLAKTRFDTYLRFAAAVCANVSAWRFKAASLGPGTSNRRLRKSTKSPKWENRFYG